MTSNNPYRENARPPETMSETKREAFAQLASLRATTYETTKHALTRLSFSGDILDAHRSTTKVYEKIADALAKLGSS